MWEKFHEYDEEINSIHELLIAIAIPNVAITNKGKLVLCEFDVLIENTKGGK